LRLAEGADKTLTLRASAAQNAPLGKDDGPGKDAEGEQYDQNAFGDCTGLKDEIDYFAADEG